MVCDAHCSRKRAGSRSADGKDHRQKSVESVESFEKQKLFRAKGKLLLSMETMFPGYIFVKSSLSKELEEELNKSREYPKLIGNEPIETIPVEEQDLRFLQAVCGKNWKAHEPFQSGGRRGRKTDPCRRDPEEV